MCDSIPNIFFLGDYMLTHSQALAVKKIGDHLRSARQTHVLHVQKHPNPFPPPTLLIYLEV